MRRLVGILAIALLLAGCGGRQAGGGEELDVCGAYWEYERLAQPAPDDAAEVREFAEVFLRIVDRVDAERRLTNREGDIVVAPPEVGQAYEALDASLTRFRDRTRSATDGAQVRTAVNELADDQAFTQADRVIADFHRQTCGGS